MAVYRYPQEVHDFVKEHCTEMRDDALAEACNKVMGTAFTKRSMKAFRSNHGYKNGLGHLTSEEMREREYYFPKELYSYVEEHSWGTSSADLARMVNEKFGTNFNAGRMKAFRARYKIKSGSKGWYQKGHVPDTKGKTIKEICKHDPEKIARVKAAQFKPGRTPYNKVPVGTITCTAEGRMLIKLSETGTQWERWHALSHYVWEQHNGPIPDNHAIIFKDGDTTNCDISNLLLVPCGDVSLMNHKGWRFKDPDLTEVAAKTVRLIRLAKQKRKGKKSDTHS